MQITKECQAEKLVLRLSGRLETATAPELQKVVDKELGSIVELVMDMANLDYISSAGLRVLLTAFKKMKEKGGSMVVQHVNESVREVFEITGFNEILNVQ